MSVENPNIEFPWQFHFPPFFTLQPHAETRAKQLAAWRSLVLEWYGATLQSKVDLREAGRSPPFANAAINRRLPEEGITAVMEELARTGHAERLDKQGYTWAVHCGRTLDEWADCLLSWARDNGMSGTVCTLYELTHGEDTVGCDFHGLDEDTLVRSVLRLQQRGHAEFMDFDDNRGVKFF